MSDYPVMTDDETCYERNGCGYSSCRLICKKNGCSVNHGCIDNTECCCSKCGNAYVGWIGEK